MGLSGAEQREILSRISEEIIPAEEFVARVDAGRPLRVKYGMDPTAPDLHLGNAIALHKLAKFQELGHQAVLIIGDVTAMVGDPSGANKTRPLLTREAVEQNARTYLDQVGRILDLDRLEVRRNGEWFGALPFADVIRLASLVTVAQLVQREDFAKRLADGQPVGLHELLYPVMQAYDSVMVKADVEIGGSDQKFNLLLGRELQRASGQPPQIIMTHPILPGLDGRKKMSKSLGNTIGVAEPPNEMFGKAMSIPDALVLEYLRWTTDLSPEEQARIADPARTHPRDAKEALGKAIVARYHDAAAAEAAAAEFRRVFSQKEIPEEMAEVAVGPPEFADGRIGIVRLVALAGFAASNSEARRLVGQGAVSIDGEKVVDPAAAVAVRGGEILRVGKLRFARLAVRP